MNAFAKDDEVGLSAVDEEKIKTEGCTLSVRDYHVKEEDGNED